MHERYRHVPGHTKKKRPNQTPLTTLSVRQAKGQASISVPHETGDTRRRLRSAVWVGKFIPHLPLVLLLPKHAPAGKLNTCANILLRFPFTALLRGSLCTGGRKLFVRCSHLYALREEKLSFAVE